MRNFQIEIGQDKTSRMRTVTADTLIEPTGYAELDSLLQLTAVAATKQDTVLARLYYDIGQIYNYFALDKCREYYLKVRDLIKAAGFGLRCEIEKTFTFL